MRHATPIALLLAAAPSSVAATEAAEYLGDVGRATLQAATDHWAAPVRIRITVGGKAVTATLADSPTSSDLVSLLPLTLMLEDHAATEKIAYLPRKLSAEGAPAGIDPAIGDVTYYAPWGNLALFYNDFPYSSGLIRLGKIDTSLDALREPGPVKAMIELINE